MKKYCWKCKEVKDTTDYNKNRTTKDGLQSVCRECQRIYSEKFNAIALEAISEFLKEYKTPDENNSDAVIRYFCETHGYEKWAQVLEKYTALTDGGCVIWQGQTTTDGYGKYNVGLPRGNYGIRAHRLSFALYHGYENLPQSQHGPNADTLVLDHMCETITCVNPLHLQVVTSAENLSFKAGRL